MNITSNSIPSGKNWRGKEKKNQQKSFSNETAVPKEVLEKLLNLEEEERNYGSFLILLENTRKEWIESEKKEKECEKKEKESKRERIISKSISNELKEKAAEEDHEVDDENDASVAIPILEDEKEYENEETSENDGTNLLETGSFGRTGANAERIRTMKKTV